MLVKASNMPSPHVLKRIRLDLARSKEYPNGSSSCGYEFLAPLDRSGHIDLDGWKALRNRCGVRRFWNDEEHKSGHLTHKAGGRDGATWIFDYDDNRVDDDESGYRFGAHAFLPGEYVTIRDQDSAHTFRVVAVENA
jgi:hypothetical protein